MEAKHVNDNNASGKKHLSYDRLEIPEGGGTADTPYPQYNVASADKWTHDWDDKTRRLIQERLENIPPYRFFNPNEIAALEAFIARVLPQEDRSLENQIPIGPWIDERLYQNQGVGYRYETMPDDPEAYRLGLGGLDQAAQFLYNAAFAELSGADQDTIIRLLAGGTIPGGAWNELPASSFFQQLMGEVITNYYAHPTAWAEIGFNGPASPRGHMRLWLGGRDPWEAEETRPRSSVEIVRRHLQQDRRPLAKGGPTH